MLFPIKPLLFVSLFYPVSIYYFIISPLDRKARKRSENFSDLLLLFSYLSYLSYDQMLFHEIYGSRKKENNKNQRQADFDIGKSQIRSNTDQFACYKDF